MHPRPLEHLQRRSRSITRGVEVHAPGPHAQRRGAVEGDDDRLGTPFDAFDAHELEARVPHSKLAGFPGERSGVELHSLLASALDHGGAQQ